MEQSNSSEDDLEKAEEAKVVTSNKNKAGPSNS
jgi:hypothetical protein